MTQMRVLSRSATDVTFADPTDPNCTIRVKRSGGVKKIGPLSVDNNVTEVISNDTVTLSEGGTILGDDAISVRMRISGSARSKSRLLRLMNMTIAYVEALEDDGVFEGFEPTATPTIIEP